MAPWSLQEKGGLFFQLLTPPHTHTHFFVIIYFQIVP